MAAPTSSQTMHNFDQTRSEANILLNTMAELVETCPITPICEPCLQRFAQGTTPNCSRFGENNRTPSS